MDKQISDKHINTIPAGLLGFSISKLSVVDRLLCERVSPRWNWILGEFGWTKEEKLNQGIALEEASKIQREKFTPENLISLLTRLAGSNLKVLDLNSFGFSRLQSYVSQVTKTLLNFPKLSKLDISGGFNLENFVDFLPRSLCSLTVSEIFSVGTLEKLSEMCPNLERVPFNWVADINYEIVNSIIKRFPRQKLLNLVDHRFHRKRGNLSSIAEQLKELEIVWLWDLGGFTGESFEAMAINCQHLKEIVCVYQIKLDRGVSLSHLAKLTNLTVLEIWDGQSVAFTDSALRAIAERGKLKRLLAWRSPFKDDSIVFLIEKCKFLVSLDISHCRQITMRSLEAVVSEVHRRHGNPPRTLPSSTKDQGIFVLGCENSGIDAKSARELTIGNSWIEISNSDSREFS